MNGTTLSTPLPFGSMWASIESSHPPSLTSVPTYHIPYPPSASFRA